MSKSSKTKGVKYRANMMPNVTVSVQSVMEESCSFAKHLRCAWFQGNISIATELCIVHVER